MLFRDMLGGDSFRIGLSVVEVGERSDYSREVYVVPINVDGHEIFLQSGASYRFCPRLDDERKSVENVVEIVARPKRGSQVTLGLRAARDIPIRVIHSERWEQTKLRRGFPPSQRARSRLVS